MSKHTPGPWRAGNWGQSIVSDTQIEGGINGSDAVESYGGHLIAESISECNRPLIMAAPDLLEALEGLYELVSTVDCNIPDPKYIRVTQAAAAIAKALGEQ